MLYSIRKAAENSVFTPGHIWPQSSKHCICYTIRCCVNKQQDRWQNKIRHTETSTLYVNVAVFYMEQENLKSSHSYDASQEHEMLHWFLVGENIKT